MGRSPPGRRIGGFLSACACAPRRVGPSREMRAAPAGVARGRWGYRAGQTILTAVPTRAVRTDRFTLALARCIGPRGGSVIIDISLV